MDKKEAVKKAKNYHKSRIGDIGLKILKMIEGGELEKFSPQSAFQFWDNGDPYDINFDSPHFLDRDKFSGSGVKSLDIENQYKYSLAYTVWKYTEDDQLVLPSGKRENEKLLENLQELVEDGLNQSFLENFLEVEDVDLEELENKILDEISSKLDSIEKQRKEEIAEGTLDKDFMEQFEKNLEKSWDENARIKKIFKEHGRYESRIDERPPDNADRHFGFLRLMERSYFIEEDLVTWARTAEQTLGRSLGRDEGKQIIKKLADYCDLPENEGDRESSSLLEDILNSENINDSSIIFIDNEQIEVIRNSSYFERKDTEQGYMSGVIRFDEDEIKICRLSSIGCMMIVDMSSCPKIIQYSAFEDLEKEYYVNVEKITESEAQDLAEESDKDVLDYKTKVKLRAAEKFRIKDGETCAVKGYRV